MFALDAIVDQEGQAWFLEMNSNPMVHPDLYGAMIASGLTAEKQLDASRHPGSGVP